MRTAGTTTPPAPSGMAMGEQAPGLDLWALVAGNDLDADRINLVFASWGWDSQSDFVELAAGSLSWSGDAYLYDEDGAITTDPATAFDAAIGLFGIEPWRSSRDRFNVWYTDREPETPVSWLNAGDQPFPVTDVVIVTLALDAHRPNPDLTSVAGQDAVFIGPGAPQRPVSGNPFAHAVVVIDSEFLVGGLIDVSHELGHGMFNLADEYVGERYGFDGRADLSSWPSCAEDLTEAEAWWGDLIGEVDPMVTIWSEEMAEAGHPLYLEAWPEQVEVAAIDGGCYGVAGSVRATADSLMNNSIPVLGWVNRRWAEQIIELWEGRLRSSPAEVRD